eukprot:772132-Pyramimonas_sp.AAC.1
MCVWHAIARQCVFESFATHIHISAAYKALFVHPPQARLATAMPRQGRREAVDCATSFGVLSGLGLGMPTLSGTPGPVRLQ